MECSQLIVTSQFGVLEFHIGFYLQSSSNPKSSTKCATKSHASQDRIAIMPRMISCVMNTPPTLS